MNKKSLITKELLTDGIIAIAYLICGLASLSKPATLLSVIIVFVALIAEICAIILQRTKNFDVWDETAKTHYSQARKFTLKTLIIALNIFVIVMVAFQISLKINGFHLMIICGLIMLLQSAAFIFYEKRDA